MVVDLAAPVLYNRQLSPHYNVIALAAPAIAAAAEPGQFVMVKPVPGFEPLLRRPFSIFEVLRDASGAPSGVTLLNKRVGIPQPASCSMRARGSTWPASVLSGARSRRSAPATTHGWSPAASGSHRSRRSPRHFVRTMYR